jgi:integrase
MRQVIIENPIINSPFEEPKRHFKFDDAGITDQVEQSRRISCYFIPIAQPKKKANQKQLSFDDWNQTRVEENKTINDIRRAVKLWREGRYSDDVTRVTARLLEYWRRSDRMRRLFFCQIEALETLIYITEAAKKYGHAWIENDLRRFKPDATTSQGRRDHAVLLFLYNTGARADETAHVQVGDLDLGHTPGRDASSALIHGKGNKERRCPLWAKTVNELLPLIQGCQQSRRALCRKSRIQATIGREETGESSHDSASRRCTCFARASISTRSASGWATCHSTRPTFMRRPISR